MVDALALEADEGRGKLRNASGSCKQTMIRRYPNEETHQQQIINLITLVGKRKFEEWYNSNKVCFKYLDYWKCL